MNKKLVIGIIITIIVSVAYAIYIIKNQKEIKNNSNELPMV